MLSSQEIAYLGQITNHTWGYPGGLNKNTPTAGINVSLQGGKMVCTYTTIVNLTSDRNLRDQSRRCEEESVAIIKQYLKELKNEFKSLAGRALKAKEVNSNDSIEIISASPYTPKRTAYYRRFTTFEVE
jgi:hypothetical protein